MKKSSMVSAFTLVELMLVVIIISILVGMVMPRLLGRTEEARITAAQTDIELNIGTAIDLYAMDTGSLPKDLDSLIQKPSDVTKWKGPYLKKRPVDPWGNQYVYKVPGAHNTDYDLYSCGKNGVEGGYDDITNWQALMQ